MGRSQCTPTVKAGSPVVDDKLLILTANTAGMAVDAGSGSLVWTSEKPDGKRVEMVGAHHSAGTEYLTPVLYPRKRYGGGQGSDPIVVGSKILVTLDITQPAGQAESLLLEPRGGRPAVLWRSPDLRLQFANPPVIDGYMYLGYGGPPSRAAALRCLERKSPGATCCQGGASTCSASS